MLRIECIMFHGTIVNIEIDQFSTFKKDFRWEIQVKWIKHCFYCTLVEKKNYIEAIYWTFSIFSSDCLVFKIYFVFVRLD